MKAAPVIRVESGRPMFKTLGQPVADRGASGPCGRHGELVQADRGHGGTPPRTQQ